MINYTLKEIEDFIDGKLIGENHNFHDVSIDSRMVSNYSKTLFFCISGGNHNGHDYIPDLISKGVRQFVVENQNVVRQYKNCSFILIKNSVDALQRLAAYHRKKFKIPIIGITGSNGKTIVKEWLSQLLSSEFVVTRNPKSYNSQVGVPLAVLLLDSNSDIGVFEAGMSKPGEMTKLETVIKPEIGIFTNFGQPHQENFKSFEQKIDEKLSLFKNVNKLIYCKDHELIDTRINTKLPSGVKTISWGSNPESDYLVRYQVSQQYSVIHIEAEQTYQFSFPYTDRASLENITHAIIASIVIDLPSITIQKHLAELHPVEMRMELKKAINNSVLINDSYNSDLGSLKISLDYLSQQGVSGNRIVVLSDILQSGVPANDLYKSVSEIISLGSVDKFIGVGKELNHHSEFFNVPSEFYATTREFLDSFPKQEINNDAILVKGARLFEFEKIVSELEYKQNRTQLEVNLDAIVHNLNSYRANLNSDTKMMAMVKALAYGSGSIEIAKTLQYNGINYLGVAFSDEGVELRKSGITTPIIVLNPEKQSYKSLIKYKLEPEAYSMTFLKDYTNFLMEEEIVHAPVHIKIDTGMHRQGLLETEKDQLVSFLKDNNCIKVQSIFSHLAASDEPQHDAFTQEQIMKFERITQDIKNALDISPICHILNSAGIERFSEAQFDMVRLGIGLYGIEATPGMSLKNVSTLKSFISQVKEVSEGETIGYGRKGKADKTIKIAVIPIGYADGLDRRLSNGFGEVYINGYYAKFIGTICMDMAMVDVSDINAKVGDEVEIFGDHILVKDLAEKLGTIPYEIFTGISERVKRIYYKT